VGTWALDFLAAGRGGWLERIAALTPTAGLRVFEHGELRLAVALAFLAASAGAMVFAAIWLASWVPVAKRAARAAAVVAVTGIAIAGASKLRPGRDFSEDRRNSFPLPDEAALARIAEPVVITVNLAAEDPRLFDLERGVLGKLRRVLPDLTVRRTAQSRSGLFESGGAYGEVWYQVGDRRAMVRSSIEAVVLEELYRLARLSPPAAGQDPPYPGYPLRARLGAAPWIFFGAWPAAAVLAFLGTRRRWRKRWNDPAR
jgi:hypothetical protein